MAVDDMGDITTLAPDVESVADLGRLLRALRRREAQHRQGPELSYRQIASRTGWSRGVIFCYLTGTQLASLERLRELARLFGAWPEEEAALAAAHARVAAARHAADTAARALAGEIVAPRALPAPVRGFTGRAADLARLDALLSADVAAGTVLISAVAGMGGVGKTSLAVCWAHRVVGRFPDGQIFVNLRGFDPAEPLTTMDALGVVLAELGVPPSALPSALPQRVALYRRLLAGRTMLVLLDNAAGVEQVRPLLPPPSCLALVTSRDDLAELVAADGARRVTLDVLAEDDALGLLRLLIGERADREPDALRTLARLCGYLPLALRVAAEHAAARTAVALADLVAELSSAHLDGLEMAGDERADIAAVLSWSLRRLPAPSARAFRLLGLVPGGAGDAHRVAGPGAAADAHGLAALLGVDVAAANELALALVRAHLLEADGAGRYVMHDLVRAYAREVVAQEVPPNERRSATTRLLDHYLATTTAAADLQYPDPRRDRPRNHPSPIQPAPVPAFESVRAAADWLAAERDNLVRACLHAARSGWPSHAVALALALTWPLKNGHHHQGLIVLGEALDAAQALGPACDRRDIADVHVWLAFTNRHLGRLDTAAAHAQRALDEHTRSQWPQGIAHSLAMLGAVRFSQGRVEEAVDCQRRGLEFARRARNRAQEVAQLNNLGWLHLRLEQHEAAAGYYRQGVLLSEETGLIIGAALCREGLAEAYTELGRYDAALELAEQALIVEVEYDLVQQQVETITAIGRINFRQGHSADAVDQHSAALTMCRDLDDPALTALVLNNLGETHLGAGDNARAADCFQHALKFADAGGDRIERTRSLVGLGDACALADDPGRARAYWTQALQANPTMCLATAARVEQRLAEAGR